MGTCKEKGTGDRGQQVYFLLRSIKYSSQGRDSILCFGLRSIFFWYDFGDSSIFFTPKGTGHNDPLTTLRYFKALRSYTSEGAKSSARQACAPDETRPVRRSKMT